MWILVRSWNMGGKDSQVDSDNSPISRGDAGRERGALKSPTVESLKVLKSQIVEGQTVEGPKVLKGLEESNSRRSKSPKVQQSRKVLKSLEKSNSQSVKQSKVQKS